MKKLYSPIKITSIFIFSLLLITTLISCQFDIEAPTVPARPTPTFTPTPRLVVWNDTKISECNRLMTAEELSRWEYVDIERIDETTAKITQNLTYDCCARINVELQEQTRTGKDLIVVEEKNIGFLCDVVGGFEIETILHDLHPDEMYDIKVTFGGRTLKNEEI